MNRITISFSNRSLEIFLLVFSFGLYVAGISSPSILTQGDESDYIRSSQEMHANSDYLSPTFRGQLRFTKPPLLYWMVAASYKLLDVSFFSSRLPSVLCAAVTILFVFRTGLLLFDRESAWISALITGTCFGMIKFSKIVLMESPLVLTYLLSFYYFARFYKEEKGSFLIASFAFLGFTALLKSPLYSLVGAATMALFLFAEGKLDRLFRPALPGAVFVALVISVPWYLAMIALHGSLFTDFYLHEHMNKFGAIPHSVLRVCFGLLLYMLPWTGYTLYAVFAIFYQGLFREWQYKLLLIVIGLFLLVFMIPDQKGLYYSIPLLPYCGLLTGGIIGSRFAPGISADFLTGIILIIAGLVFAASIGLLGSTMIFSLIASVLALGAAIFVMRGHRTLAMILAGLSMVPLYTHIFPSINFEIIPVEQTLAIIGERPINSYRISPLKFSNALGKDVYEILEPENLEEPIAAGGLVILSQEDYKVLDPEMRTQTNILLRWKRWRRRIPFDEFFRAIFAGKPESLHEEVFLIGR
ncbi:MAG: ArnT family glycosyltransferase [Gammaproteobacteria bacterium]